MYQQILRTITTRPQNANKYDFGHVLVIGGSPGTIGAPLLAATAALKVGAGLVTVASYAEVIDKVEEHVLDVMTLRLPHGEAGAVQTIQEFIEAHKVTAVAIGSGLPLPFAALSQWLMPVLTIPAVLDAASLTCFKDDLEELGDAARHTPVIATPHDGEYRQLTGETLPTEPALRRQVAIARAQQLHLTLVCKGPHTVVAHPDGAAYEEPAGNPGMAKAGMGDVLTGIIAGLLAQGVEPSTAAELGVHLHALAGDIAARTETQAGILASELIDLLPQAMRQAESNT